MGEGHITNDLLALKTKLDLQSENGEKWPENPEKLPPYHSAASSIYFWYILEAVKVSKLAREFQVPRRRNQ